MLDELLSQIYLFRVDDKFLGLQDRLIGVGGGGGDDVTDGNMSTRLKEVGKNKVGKDGMSVEEGNAMEYL